MPDDNPAGSTPARWSKSSPDVDLAETTFARTDTPADTPAEPPRPAVVAGTAQAWVGKSLGKYQVTGVLGQGGMGVILKAHDPMIERDVAIKVLARHLAADASASARFLAEARAAGKLNHPNVISIYEICREGPTYYLVLEYAGGGSLGDRLARREPVPVGDWFDQPGLKAKTQQSEGHTMRIRARATWAVCLLAALLAGVIVAGDGQSPPARAAKQPDKAANEPAFGNDKERDADREAIRQSAREFNEAFAKGDAKAVAAFWTANGEYQEEGGIDLRGRDAIEKAFTELFKDKAHGKVEVEIHAIRFPSRDTAIEEGFLRHTPDGPGLPSSTLYRALHVREDEKWKIAASREWGRGEDRLGDLAWLIGKWEGGPKGQEVSLVFEKDPATPFIVGRFNRKADGKSVASGVMKIGLDTQRGQLHSWHFDDGGGHGESLWVRDGNRWVLDAVGAQGDGVPTEAVNVLSRLSNDEFTWRSIDRVVGGEPLPDTMPVKLTRVRDRK
jgi:uncharacterized protein (TIGR02246 family)